MILIINSTLIDQLAVSLVKGQNVLIKKKIKAKRQQAEKLLPSIEKLLKAVKLTLSDINEIKVANQGGSFTSLRIGVLTANALAYALKIPVTSLTEPVKKNSRFNLVEPIYDQTVNFGGKKAAGSNKA